MLVIGLLLAGAVAWLLERISQVPRIRTGAVIC
jgi:hypothetical protein